MQNKMKLSFLSIPENQAFARNVIASFALQLNPTLIELNDLKTAVSEAVTNATVHGYPDSVGEIVMEATIDGNEIHIKISDCGVGIEDLTVALEPFYSTKGDSERSGMGFTIMKSFMSNLEVDSSLNVGTVVKMSKIINLKQAE